MPVEVKCPYPSNDESGLLDLFKTRKSQFYITVTFNKSHDVYDQIQKQIHATGKEKGHLAVHYNDDNGKEETIVVSVPKDQDRIDELLKEEEKKEKTEKKTSKISEKKNKEGFEAARKEFKTEIKILMFHNKKVELEALTNTGEPIVLRYVTPKKGKGSLLDMIKNGKGKFCITITFNKSNKAYNQVQKQIHATKTNQGYLVVHYNNEKDKKETVVVPVPKDMERIDELLKKATEGEEEEEGEAEEGEEGEEKKEEGKGGSGGGGGSEGKDGGGGGGRKNGGKGKKGGGERGKGGK